MATKIKFSPRKLMKMADEVMRQRLKFPRASGVKTQALRSLRVNLTAAPASGA